MRRAVATLAALALSLAGAAEAKTHLIVGRGVAWSPRTLEVQRGDVVEWKNADIVPHNVRSDAPQFASRTLEPGQRYVWKAAKKGTFPYRCTLHPEMTGTLSVR